MLKRLAAVLAVMSAVFLVLVPPALAGGPTSVLITNPAGSKAAGWYTSQAEYQALSTALGENPQVSAKDAPSDLRGGPGSNAINVTWLIHDVRVWRVDRVFLDYPGGPWIVTNTNMGGPLDPGEQRGEQGGERGVVHRPSDPAALPALLARLLNTELSNSTGPAQQASLLPISTPTPLPAQGAWNWGSALLGVAGGVLLMTVVQLALRRRVPA
ncbi:MAG: hypothetical protein ABW215_21405 [Kibdelosporangium sp.]